MKRILNILFVLVAIVGSASAQGLSVQPIEALTGGQSEVAVSLMGGTTTTALQFNLQLPAGVTANTDNATLGTGTDGHTLTIETLDSGDLLFVLYSLDLKTFKDGELLRIPVTAGNTEVSSQGKLYTVRTASISGDDAVSHACADATFSVTVSTPEPPITITADNLRKVYGSDLPELTYKVEGGELKGTPKLSTTATKASPVGTYPITVEQGTVTNKQVTYVAGTLTIREATLTVSIGNYTREQGQENPEFKLLYSGWRNNEDESVLTKKPVATTTATKDSPVGTYPITVSGGEAQNYKFTYTGGTLTVTVSTAISDILASGKPFDVYTLSGQKLRRQVTTLEGLPKGIYIIEGRKVTIR